MKLTICLFVIGLVVAGCAPEGAFTPLESQTLDSASAAGGGGKEPSEPVREEKYFNQYILQAVAYLNQNYSLLGYNKKAILTHDIEYFTYGTIKRTYGAQTMCVAAQMEVILTAMELYARANNDYSLYDYLPKRSWEYLSKQDIKGHIWVNAKFNAYGTADALVHFGMGEVVPFEKLEPGSFVNINRTNRTGHAVTFISFIDKNGREYAGYNDTVVGFKYFSAQGHADVGNGGLDFRYAVFDKFGCPEMPAKVRRDCGVIYSNKETMLNTGKMLVPKLWNKNLVVHTMSVIPDDAEDTLFDADYFNGLTTDD